MSKRQKSWNVRQAYEFIKAHRHEYDIKTMCGALEISRTGYHAWLHEPLSNRAKDDTRLLRLIRSSYKASRGVYGSTRICLDLREAPVWER
jgi:putative transposase